jgi:hypothetical protein
MAKKLVAQSPIRMAMNLVGTLKTHADFVASCDFLTPQKFIKASSMSKANFTVTLSIQRVMVTIIVAVL